MMKFSEEHFQTLQSYMHQFLQERGLTCQAILDYYADPENVVPLNLGRARCIQRRAVWDTFWALRRRFRVELDPIFWQDQDGLQTPTGYTDKHIETALRKIFKDAGATLTVWPANSTGLKEGEVQS